MAIFTAWAKICSAKYFCSAKVSGLGENFRLYGVLCPVSKIILSIQNSIQGGDKSKDDSSLASDESDPFHRRLSMDDLKLVLEELVEISARWYTLGLQLSLPVGFLDSLKSASIFSCTDCLREVLAYWLKSGNASWATLYRALMSRTVHHLALAHRLLMKYNLSEGYHKQAEGAVN